MLIFSFLTCSLQKVLPKNCLFTLDAKALSIDQITSVVCGKEEDENVAFDYEELENNIDYEVTRQGDIISIQVMKELDTGYVYHFNVHTLLEHGKGEKAFKTIIHPRGINFIENHNSYYCFFILLSF